MSGKKSKEEMEDLVRHLKLLRVRARKRGVQAEDAEDLAHDAFIKACTRENPLPECSEERKAILLTILKYEVLSYFKEDKREFTRAARAHIAATVMGVGYAQDKAAVLEARQQLELIFPHVPQQHLHLYIEKVLDGLTVPEVAELLGMNVNTAQSYWQRAREKLGEELHKLDKPRRRRVRGALILVWISGILGAARNANAMVGWLVRFFRSIVSFGRAQVHALTAVAAGAALVMVSPGQTSASADETVAAVRLAAEASASTSTVAPALSISGATVESAPAEIVVPKASPSVHVQRAVPKARPKKQATAAARPDGLIMQAKAALKQGDPVRAMELLNKLPQIDPRSDEAVTVNNVRAMVERAVAGKR